MHVIVGHREADDEHLLLEQRARDEPAQRLAGEEGGSGGEAAGIIAAVGPGVAGVAVEGKAMDAVTTVPVVGGVVAEPAAIAAETAEKLAADRAAAEAAPLTLKRRTRSARASRALAGDASAGRTRTSGDVSCTSGARSADLACGSRDIRVACAAALPYLDRARVRGWSRDIRVACAVAIAMLRARNGG